MTARERKINSECELPVDVPAIEVKEKEVPETENFVPLIECGT